MNPNDEMRTQILQWFYDRNATATSQYGKKGSAVKISDAKSGLKAYAGLTQQQVMANLTYLVDKGWINQSAVEKTFQTKAGSIPSVVVWYQISSAGIDKIEGDSEFQQNNRFAGINISASGTNIITLGDGNVVNAEFVPLREMMEELKNVIVTSDEIDDTVKLDVMADIESIKDQLSKNVPNKSVIQSLWGQIEKAATVSGVVDLVQKIAPFVAAAVS